VVDSAAGEAVASPVALRDGAAIGTVIEVAADGASRSRCWTYGMAEDAIGAGTIAREGVDAQEAGSV
jgi:hypothetical protein